MATRAHTKSKSALEAEFIISAELETTLGVPQENILGPVVQTIYIAEFGVLKRLDSCAKAQISPSTIFE